MRIQATQQKVCQVFFAVFCHFFVFTSGKWKEFAALRQIVYTNINSFVYANWI